jgi:DNA-binding NarL/FixJ family response regulator
MKKITLYLPVIVLAMAMIFFAYDIIVDVINDGDSLVHLFIELMVFVAISYVLFRELQHVSRLNQAITMERSKTARLAGELFNVMQAQFVQWKLSPSEKNVALLLIKGLSMKEIAEARDVKEKTIRLQASAIYIKSGHAGRHELAAYFIEDLINEL